MFKVHLLHFSSGLAILSFELMRSKMNKLSWYNHHKKQEERISLDFLQSFL